MRFVAIKDIGDGFTFIGGKRRHIDQRFYVLLIRSCNHCTGIGVSRDNHGTLCSGDRPVQRDDIFAERGERERRSNKFAKPRRAPAGSPFALRIFLGSA